jgi:peptidoglycan/xylan/chitin deacetylase (PgdA/CDA1 family)
LSNWVAMLAFGLFAALLAPKIAPAVLPPPAPPPAPIPPRAVVLAEVLGAPPGPPTVALTFDDGPDPRWTPKILELLRSHGAVATFCMVGAQVRRHPELVRDVVEAGMRLCDHTYSHDEELPERPVRTLRREIVDPQRELAAAGDAPVAYFRAPGGNWSPAVLDLAVAHGMHPLGWSVDPRDWKRPGAVEIVEIVQRKMHPGAVVLLHDGGGPRDQTVAALEQLLPWLVAEGYQFGFPTP